MLRSVWLKTLRDARRAQIWWSVGLIGLAVWVAALYPSYEQVAEDLRRFFEEAPAAMKVFFGGELDIATPEGFFNTELFSFMVPLLLIILAVSHGQRALAGEERRGTLDLLLANPLPRRRLVAEKFGAMATTILGAAAVLAVALIAATLATGLDLSPLRLAQASLMAGLLGLAFGAIALALGGMTGATGTSIGVTVAVAVASYLLNGLAELVPVLEPYRYLSLFYYYSEAAPLVNGIVWLHAGVLTTVAAAGLAVASFTFERRDLGV